jgi:ribosomal protein L14
VFHDSHNDQLQSIESYEQFDDNSGIVKQMQGEPQGKRFIGGTVRRYPKRKSKKKKST